MHQKSIWFRRPHDEMVPSASSGWQSANGFTIIELLVVIAIIGVLLTLLLPSLNEAKQVASRIRCASNQRQVGVSLNSYATEQRQFPTPDGQTNFNSSVMNMGTIPAVWNGWAGYGSTSWNYGFGTYVWWVGAATQDTTWYNRKEFMCTASNQNGIPYAAWQERENGSDPTTFGSVINGQLVMNPSASQNVASPWYLYFHPYTFSTNAYDFWDWGIGTTDVANQVFGRNVGWYTEYQVASWDGLNYPIIPGPRYGEVGRRRAQLTCPGLSNFPPLAPARTLYEPHGDQLYAGVQMNRSAADPEARNYLFTDGSVVYISH